MRHLVTLAVAALAACSPTARRTALERAGQVALVGAVGGVACDWAQTHHIASDGWRHTSEANPILGKKPTSGEVDAYMTVATVLLVVGWKVAPRWLRPAAAFLAVSQGFTVAGNAEVPHGTWCGL